MARKKKQVNVDTAPIAVLEPVATVASTLSPEQQAAIAKQRTDELSTARARYLTCTGGKRQKAGMPSGGSDLVGRALRALKLIDGSDFVDTDKLIEVLGTVDNTALMAWATPYLDGLVENKNRERRRIAFAQFVVADGFRSLQMALTTFRNHRSWQWSEVVRNPKTNTSIKVAIDVPTELNNMFALKLTNNRRVKWGVMSA